MLLYHQIRYTYLASSNITLAPQNVYANTGFYYSDMFFFSVQLNAEDRDSIVTLNASLNKHTYIYILRKM